MNTQKELEMLPSIVILKNSIAEGRIPLESDLEVGELGLGLSAGTENIWAKNSDGKIVNLRSPRHDLFWGDLFLSFPDKATFEEALGKGEVKSTCLVYIKTESLIWNDGNYYSTSYTEEDIVGIIKNHTVTIPDEVFKLTSSSTNQEISDAFGGHSNFLRLVKTVQYKTAAVSMSYVGFERYAPVSIYTRRGFTDEYTLTLDWIIGGSYHSIDIHADEYSSDHQFEVRNRSEVYLSYLQNQVDQIIEGNKDLVKPVISGSWTFHNQKFDVVSISGVSPDTHNPRIEKGYSAEFTGTYKWTEEYGKKNPSGYATESSWWDLPKSGENSEELSKIFWSTSSVVAKLEAPKTGLMVSGTNVLLAEGDDYTQDTWTVTFLDRLYYGNLGKESGFDQADIKGLANTELVSTKGKIIKNVSPGPSEWFVYAYPKSLGELGQIIQDGATPVLGAFKKTELKLTNAAGLEVELLVYVTNNPGAFTGATLEFK